MSSKTLKKILRALRPMVHFLQSIAAHLETMLIFPSLFRSVPSSSEKTRGLHDVRPICDRTLEDFAQEVGRLFEDPVTLRNLLSMSQRLQEQFRKCALSSPHCMLPSYNHTLPTGREKGTYLALDVGGSTLRVALVELKGNDKPMRILSSVTTVIDNKVKALHGTCFFDWIAEKIEEMLIAAGDVYGHEDRPLATGLAWSFPIE